MEKTDMEGIEEITILILDMLAQREKTHGNATECLQRIAERWSKPGENVTPVDVCKQMIELKLARIDSGKHHTDSFNDIAGYAILALVCNEINQQIQ